MEFRENKALIATNGRIRQIPDENGVYQDYELVVFPDATFIPHGWEAADKAPKAQQLHIDDLPVPDAKAAAAAAAENRRKAYGRARNKLFDILLCTLEFDSFVTLTLDGDKVDRYDYDEAVKKLGVWLDNKVRRQGLVYALVPEKHKDGAIHFHGLVNRAAFKLTEAVNPHSGELIKDKRGTQVYNISDFKLGFSTLIPLAGTNARTAAAKYCYKYITKTGGEKVGGRYYLSGGKLGKPRYKLIDVNYAELNAPEYHFGGCMSCKKVKL